MLHFLFKSMTCFMFIFIQCVSSVFWGQVLFILPIDVELFQHHLLRSLFSFSRVALTSVIISCSRGVGLLLGFLMCLSLPLPTSQSWLLKLHSEFWNVELIPPTLFFLFKIILTVQLSLISHINFRIKFLYL